MQPLRLALAAISFSLVTACGGGGGGGAVANNTAIVGVTLDNPVAPTKLVVANADNQTIQTLTLSGNAVAVLAGTANVAGTTDGTGTAAKFYEPFGITLNGSDYFVADTYNHTVRKVTSAGVVTTIAGTAGTSGSADGTGSSALFYGPKSLVGDGANLYVNDTYNHSIRKVVIATGATTTLAGYAGTSGTTDGTGSAARFYAPFGITYDGINLFVTDTGNQTIRMATSGGTVTTLAGTAGTSGSTDGTGTSARFDKPAGIVYYNDPANGDVLFVADSSNHTIRQIVIASGVVTTVAGIAGTSGSTDGTGSSARFNTPIGLTIDNSGNLYVVDQNYSKIRKVVTSTGVVTTIQAAF